MSVIPNVSSCIPSTLGILPCLPITFGDLSHIFGLCNSQIPVDLFCWIINSSELLVSGCWESRMGGKGRIFPEIWEALGVLDTSSGCWEELEQIQPDTAQTKLNSPCPS